MKRKALSAAICLAIASILSAQPPSIRYVGSGCGPRNLLLIGGEPAIGSGPIVILSATQAPGPVALWLGDSANIDLGQLGALGCTLYSLPWLTIPGSLDLQGYFEVVLEIPKLSSLIGAQATCQGVIVSPTNALGVVTSRAAELTLGENRWSERTGGTLTWRAPRALSVTVEAWGGGGAGGRGDGNPGSGGGGGYARSIVNVVAGDSLLIEVGRGGDIESQSGSDGGRGGWASRVRHQDAAGTHLVVIAGGGGGGGGAVASQNGGAGGAGGGVDGVGSSTGNGGGSGGTQTAPGVGGGGALAGIAGWNTEGGGNNAPYGTLLIGGQQRLAWVFSTGAGGGGGGYFGGGSGAAESTLTGAGGGGGGGGGSSFGGLTAPGSGRQPGNAAGALGAGIGGTPGTPGVDGAVQLSW